MITVQTIKVGQLKTNCYIVSKENYCIVIDPGSDDQKDIASINNTIGNKRILAIICTHNHFDHIGGVHCFKNIPCFMDKEDIDRIEMQTLRAQLFTDQKIIIPTEIQPLQGTMSFKDIEFEVFKTPGHTKGGVSLYLKNEQILFTGDTLFKNTYGRTDVGGDKHELLQSLKLLSTFPEETTIFPGHGQSSTLGKEKRWILKLEKHIFFE